MATEARPAMSVTTLEEERQREADITSSLTRLQEMHVALRHLRESIPRVVESVLPEQISPDLVYSNFSHAALGAGHDIKELKKLLEAKPSREVFEKAKDSREKDPGEIAAWRVTEHEKWMNVKKEDDNEGLGLESSDEQASEDTGKGEKEDMLEVLETFREAHPGIEASLDQASKLLKVYLPRPAKIHFQIEPKCNSESKTSYSVDSAEKTKLHNSIVEAIASHSHTYGLALLLVRFLLMLLSIALLIHK